MSNSAPELLHTSQIDPDHLSELVSKPACTVRYEPLTPASGFDHTIDISPVGSLITLQSSSRHGFQAQLEMENTERLEIHFIEQGHYRSGVGSTVDAMSGQAFLQRGAGEYRITSQPGTRQTCIAVPFERCVRLFALDIDDPLTEIARFNPFTEFRNGPMQVLHGIGKLLAASENGDHPLSTLPLGASLLEEAFLATLVEAWPQEKDRAFSAKPVPVYVRMATDWIEAHIAEKIHLEDLAGVTGVTVRALQTGFRDVYDMSPVAYILKLRLQQVHRELLAAGPEISIQEIAFKWGFAHMSDFAMRYRRLFGRPPSETRRQALRHH